MSSRPPSTVSSAVLRIAPGIDPAAAIGEGAGGELGPLEDPVDRLEVEFLGQVEHREILVVEVLDLLRLARSRRAARWR